jgi:hypothetical protein
MNSGHSHQKLRRINVNGVKPPDSQWFECTCGHQLLMSIIASIPQDPEVSDATARGVTISRQYTARDKTDWASLEQALARNAVLKEVEEINTLLEPRTTAVEEGEGFIQQDLEQVKSALEMLRKLLIKPYGRKPTETLDQLIVEILEDGVPMDEDPLYLLYLRLNCIDSEGREWQTADLARHPESGRHVRLNPEKKAT